MVVACLALAAGVARADGNLVEAGTRSKAAVADPAAAAGTTEYRRGDFRFAVGPVPAFVVRHAIPSQWDPAAPGAHDSPWRYWLNDLQVDRRTGHDAAFVDYAYEVTSASLLDDAGRYEVDFNPTYQRLSLHSVEVRRGGQWLDRLDPARISLARRETGFENNMADGEVTALIVLDDVRVGDVVRIAYTTTGSNPVLAGQGMDGGTLGWRNPILDSYMSLLADPGTQFSIHRENAVPEPEIELGPAASRVRFHMHAVQAVVDEGNYPVWYQPDPFVQVTARRSWMQVADWALPLYPPSSDLPADLQARIVSWKALPTPRARLKAALRAVQDEVRYFGTELGENTHRPAAPADTWNHRRGDCKDKAYLLSTVLHALDIDAVPALTSMGRGRALFDMPASAAAFDHVIVRATIDGSPLWVDPTMSQVGGDPGRVDLSRYGAALPVRAGATLEAIAPPVGNGPASVDVTERITPAAGGHFGLDVITESRGASADSTRHYFASERISDIGRRYADFYRKRFGELRMTADPAMQDDREANVVIVTEHYLVDAPFDAGNPASRSIDVYPDAVAPPAALPSTLARSGPMYLDKPGEYHHHLRVAVPAGWQPLFGHEQEEQRGSAFTYQRTLDVDKDGARLDYAFVVRSYDVGAADAAAEVRELRKVNDSLPARLRYQVPVALDAGERDDRLKALLHDVMDKESGK